uniref:Uncharacterized protein n=1 Tax=Panagrolaimus davidi TaxID=227884 RepID=A0A914QJE3_9BILA
MEPENEHRIIITPATTTISEPPEFRRNVTWEQKIETTAPAFTFVEKEKLSPIAILLAIIGTFFSVVAFSLNHIADDDYLKIVHIFSEYTLVLSIIIFFALIFVHFHPKHKWIYYCLICLSIISVILNIANFVIHMYFIERSRNFLRAFGSEINGEIIKAGAGFVFMDGVFKALISVMCVVIVFKEN